MPKGEPLDCCACGKKYCVPSIRTSARGQWIDIQAPNLKFGGCCSFECMKSLVVDDALRADGNISFNVAKSKWGTY